MAIIMPSAEQKLEMRSVLCGVRVCPKCRAVERSSANATAGRFDFEAVCAYAHDFCACVCCLRACATSRVIIIIIRNQTKTANQAAFVAGGPPVLPGGPPAPGTSTGNTAAKHTSALQAVINESDLEKITGSSVTSTVSSSSHFYTHLLIYDFPPANI